MDVDETISAEEFTRRAELVSATGWESIGKKVVTASWGMVKGDK